jgi:hypothetical protein
VRGTSSRIKLAGAALDLLEEFRTLTDLAGGGYGSACHRGHPLKSVLFELARVI